MSGALAQYRPASKPMIIGGVPVLKFDKHGKPVWKHVLKPGGTYVNGRCVDYQVLRYVATRHENVPPVEQNRPSKHARGRTRPRTRAEQKKTSALLARFAQISKSHTVDHNRMRAIHDEV